MRRRWALVMGGMIAAMLLAACGPAAPTPTPAIKATAAKPAAAGTPDAFGGAGTPAAKPSTPAAAKPAAAAPKPAGKQYPAPPAMAIDPAKKYTAVMTTTKGAITIELLPGDAPQTVNNFVFLAREGFYDGVIFHRTISGFMIQGGDPTGSGGGGPGYRFKDEPVTRDYARGIVAMANAGPNTNGSQFFIMHGDRALPKNYTIFGRVTSGMEAVDAIATAPTQPGGEGSRPVEPAQITKVEIREQ